MSTKPARLSRRAISLESIVSRNEPIQHMVMKVVVVEYLSLAIHVARHRFLVPFQQVEAMFYTQHLACIHQMLGYSTIP